MKTFVINKRSTKQEIIDGAEEYIEHLEETTLPKESALKLGCLFFAIGVMAGLGV